MLHSPRTTLLLGLGAFAPIGVAAAGIVTKWIVKKISPALWPSWIDHFFIKGTVILAFAGFTCFAYARFIEPNWPKVEHIHLQSSKVKPGGEPIRIVQISDLHIEGESRLIKKVSQLIEAERPHIIAFTGDAVNSSEGIPLFMDMMSELSEIAPTFVIYGSGDGKLKQMRLFARSGVTELNPTSTKKI